MKNFILASTAGLMLCVAVYAPWLYLLGILTSYVPSYLFLFKKAILRTEEIAENFPLSTKKLEHESRAAFNVRQVLIGSMWALSCIFFWWLFFLVSLSGKATEDFIQGLQRGMS